MYKLIKNISRHSLIYGASSILSGSVGFFLIPLYTHYLTPADYGILELLDLTSYIFGMLAAMGIKNALIRFYYDYAEQEKRDQVICVALFSAIAASVVFLIVSFFFSKQISSLVFKSPEYYRMLEIIFASMVFNFTVQLPLTVLQIQQKSIMYVTISLIKTTLTLSLNILFIVYFKMGVLGILLSGLIVASAMGMYMLFYQLRKIKISFSFDLLKSMLKYGIPLAWGTLGMFMVNFADRFLLQRFSTLNELGLYSLAYRFGFLPSIIVMGPFMMVWGPKRFEVVKEPDAKSIYSVIFTYLAFLLIYAVLGISVLIKDVITVVADPKYLSSYKYVSTILLAFVFNGGNVYFQFGIHLSKKTKYISYSSFAAAAINIGGNILLIPILNAWGAAITTLLSYLFLSIFSYVVSQKLYHVPYEYGRILKMTVLALLLFLTASLINPSSIFLSITVKFLIALSFPLVLYLFKFYSAEEKAKISQIFGQLYGFVKSKIGLSST